MRLTVVAVVVTAFLGGCSQPPAPAAATLTTGDSGTAAKTRSAQLDRVRPVRATWEKAAVAEATRLTPGLTNATAERVLLGRPAVIERVRVTASGYCHIFGGQFADQQGWQANDLGDC